MNGTPNGSSNPPTMASASEAVVALRRFVNDEIAVTARRFTVGPEPESFEFLCECGALSCERRVSMTLAEYATTAPGSVRVPGEHERLSSAPAERGRPSGGPMQS
jgi:hypothetical protein